MTPKSSSVVVAEAAAAGETERAADSVVAAAGFAFVGDFAAAVAVATVVDVAAGNGSAGA